MENDAGKQTRIRIPDLTDVTFRLADELSPLLQRHGKRPGDLQPLDVSWLLGPTFCFAASLVSNLFGGFTKELGAQAAKKVVSLDFSLFRTARPSEAVDQIKQLQEHAKHLVVPVESRRELQIILDNSMANLRQSLSEGGFSDAEVHSIASKLEASLAAEIDLQI